MHWEEIMLNRRGGLRVGLALWAALLVPVAHADGPDEQWEMTTEMKMQGMSMPGSKSLVCQPASAAYDPQRDEMQKNCTMSDIRTVGNRTSWKMACTGENAMQGEGDMLRTADALKGTMKVQSHGMAMTMVMSGRRVGTCSAVAEKRKVEAMVADAQAKGREATEQACAQMTDMVVSSGGSEGQPATEFSAGGMCAASKQALCEKARAFAAGYDGFAAYSRSKGWVVAACGIQLAANRAPLCQKAFGAKRYGFLRNECPVEAKAARAAHCAGFGRGYTADAANPYAALCRN
jgi:hypothetical protein